MTEDVVRDGFSISSLWNDSRYRSVLVQFVTLVAIFLFFGYLINNAVTNLASQGKTFGFEFLDLPASYDINQHLIPYTSQSPHWQAAVVGILNTLLVAVVGCIVATVFGFVLGVLRLSNNWLVNRVAYCYIEFTRNVPVLLHILFWHGIIINVMPSPKALLLEGGGGGNFFLTNRGFIMPKPLIEDGFGFVVVAFGVGIIATFLLARWAKRRQERTGAILSMLLPSLGLIIGLPILVYFLIGQPIGLENPEPGRFNFKGGMKISPEFFALTFALSVYTAAFIGEIVRAGIQAIPKGQWEAASALGLKRGWVLRRIIIPQALRIIVPPLTSMYLNLTKNSSLAIAIGYMDVVATLGGITLMQTGKEMETNIMLMLFYLLISLVIAGVMNAYNKAIALKER
ncbi:MAG: ABC transporter permease subunit [Gammaproteobacteria bacterium]|nr:ABC transporter permease subunit [Gammaproteobacteria bacterium]